jgi:ABC-type multidrug transport system fused ATPase/permease subunit
VTALISIIGESAFLFATLMIRYLAQYLVKLENDTGEAAILVAAFTVSILVGSLFRNFYYYYGYVMALEARKMLVSAMYDKVAKLSMRSLTETNSGKLITLVSCEIFTLERPLSMAPFILAAPFINLVCYGLIWFIAGWPYAVMMFGLWILTVLCQIWVSSSQRKLK